MKKYISANEVLDLVSQNRTSEIHTETRRPEYYQKPDHTPGTHNFTFKTYSNQIGLMWSTDEGDPCICIEPQLPIKNIADSNDSDYEYSLYIFN